jgi:hypothetical protein
MKDEINIDMPRVSATRATELVAYHLSLAAAYYEATPEGSRTVKRVGKLIGPDTPGFGAMQAWFAELDTYYAGLDK